MNLITDLEPSLNILIFVRNIYVNNIQGVRRFPSVTFSHEVFLTEEVFESRLHSIWDELVSEKGTAPKKHTITNITQDYMPMLFADVPNRPFVYAAVQEAFLSWYTHFAWLYTEVSQSLSQSLYTKLGARHPDTADRFYLSLIYDKFPSNYRDQDDRHLVIACTPSFLRDAQATIDHFIENATPS